MALCTKQRGDRICGLFRPWSWPAYAQTPEMAVIHSAADALGGLDRIRAVKTLIIEGEGTNPNVGQNRNPDDPLLDWKVTEYKKTIDLAGGRMRLEQHRQAQFAFSMANDVRQNFVLDGDIAFNLDATGKASRAAEAAVRERRHRDARQPGDDRPRRARSGHQAKASS